MCITTLGRFPYPVPSINYDRRRVCSPPAFRVYGGIVTQMPRNAVMLSPKRHGRDARENLVERQAGLE